MWHAHKRSDAYILNRYALLWQDTIVAHSHQYELRIDPKGIYTARLTIDFIVSFKISHGWQQDLISADTSAAISPR